MINIEELLTSRRTVAVVGLSQSSNRTSNSIARYLIREGFTVVPVNPNCDEILGLQCYPDLVSIPEEIDVEIVDVFRRPQHTEGVVADAVKRKQKTGQEPVIWTQIGVSSAEASELARQNGLGYVANRCILVEHQRYARID